MTQADDIADDFEPAPPDKLAAYHRRQLSAMLDGEVSPDEARFMLRRLQHDSELAACWERWQVCGDVLRGKGHALLPGGFSHRVAMAVAGEASPAESRPALAPRSTRLPRWAAGAALAASVAVVALFTVRQMPDNAMRDDTGIAEVDASPAPAAVSPPAAPTGTAVQSPAPTAVASTLLATAAVAELPRQAAQRRSRAQSQRAANRVQQRLAAESIPEPRTAVAAAAPVTGSATAATGAVDARGNPFAPQAESPARPWPRAILPGVGGGDVFTASYQASAPAGGFHPFQPRLQAAGARVQPAGGESGPPADERPSPP